MTHAPSVQRALLALREAYREKLPSRLAELREAVDALRGGGDVHWQRARLLAHRLHGTGGSYGFEDISALGAELEQLLETGQDDPSFWAAAQSCLAELEKKVGKARL